MYSDSMKFVASIAHARKHFCNGCLISGKHVITSAQCVHKIFSFGRTEFYKNTVLITIFTFYIDHAIANDLYSHECRKKSLGYDVGLLQVILF